MICWFYLATLLQLHRIIALIMQIGLKWFIIVSNGMIPYWQFWTFVFGHKAGIYSFIYLFISFPHSNVWIWFEIECSNFIRLIYILFVTYYITVWNTCLTQVVQFITNLTETVSAVRWYWDHIRICAFTFTISGSNTLILQYMILVRQSICTQIFNTELRLIFST